MQLSIEFTCTEILAFLNGHNTFSATLIRAISKKPLLRLIVGYQENFSDFLIQWDKLGLRRAEGS